ncbi:hypothetical protein D9756_007923 [Leucocoprinus leucothites]|uniref:Uncharacterized protein n=1 Tax=Leucocoprinus leucothites TaxID=201217 RepID=A0A8H5D4H3_9AGAR|nr:hypothetical protein D9756_007923 [Leucoagaricus leucothites]
MDPFLEFCLSVQRELGFIPCLCVDLLPDLKILGHCADPVFCPYPTNLATVTITQCSTSTTDTPSCPPVVSTTTPPPTTSGSSSSTSVTTSYFTLTEPFTSIVTRTVTSTLTTEESPSTITLRTTPTVTIPSETSTLITSPSHEEHIKTTTESTTQRTTIEPSPTCGTNITHHGPSAIEKAFPWVAAGLGIAVVFIIAVGMNYLCRRIRRRKTRDVRRTPWALWEETNPDHGEEGRNREATGVTQASTAAGGLPAIPTPTYSPKLGVLMTESSRCPPSTPLKSPRPEIRVAPSRISTQCTRNTLRSSVAAGIQIGQHLTPIRRTYTPPTSPSASTEYLLAGEDDSDMLANEPAQRVEGRTSSLGLREPYHRNSSASVFFGVFRRRHRENELAELRRAVERLEMELREAREDRWGQTEAVIDIGRSHPGVVDQEHRLRDVSEGSERTGVSGPPEYTSQLASSPENARIGEDEV